MAEIKNKNRILQFFPCFARKTCKIGRRKKKGRQVMWFIIVSVIYIHSSFKSNAILVEKFEFKLLRKKGVDDILQQSCQKLFELENSLGMQECTRNGSVVVRGTSIYYMLNHSVLWAQSPPPSPGPRTLQQNQFCAEVRFLKVPKIIYQGFLMILRNAYLPS